MSMDDYRRMAAKMDQHMRQLAGQGVNEAPIIFDRMMVYIPDLQRIWNGTTDSQLIALSNEFPRFYRYAFIVEEAFEAERKKPSRPYDGMQEFSEPHKKMMSAILTDAATLERGYQAFLGSGRQDALRLQVRELDNLHRKWLSDMGNFRNSLKSDVAAAKALDYVEIGLVRIVDRIAELAKRSAQ